MKALIEGFLKFQSEAFPQRSDLFKHLATTQPFGGQYGTGILFDLKALKVAVSHIL